MKGFREKHIEIFTRYVIFPSLGLSRSGDDSLSEKIKSRDVSQSPQLSVNLAESESDTDSIHDLKGTGGTPLISFLRQTRDETSTTAIDPKARQRMLEGKFESKNTMV